MSTLHKFNKLALIILCAIFFLNPFFINAQPNSRGFNYQGIARDKNGITIPNKDIVIEVSIRAGGTLGPIVWQEGHQLITNSFGLFSIVIGQGITTGIGSLSNFKDIPWSVSDYFVRIRIDFGNGLVDMGVTKLQAVPYAMIADSVRHSSAYAVGTGLTLSANTLSHSMHSGDAIGITNLSVIGLQGRPLVGNAPALNEVIKWNGSAWAPATDDNTIYTAGTGISISGTSISQLSHIGDATGSNALTVTGIQGRSVSSAVPVNGDILKWNGTNWIPVVDDNTTYTAGVGISLTGTAFSHQAHSGDATGISTITVTGLQGRLLSANAPLNGDVLKWNGTDWAPNADNSFQYAAGNGLSLSLNTFSVLPHTHTGDVFGQTSLTVQGFQGRAVSANAPLNGDVLKWNNTNSQWEPAFDNGNAYSAGTGIIINANTFSADNSLAIWNASNLQGNIISTNVPNSGEVLSWNGAAWIPTIPSGSTYAAGTGITLTANTFSADNSIAIWNASQLLGNNISTVAPNSGEVLGWDGTNWIPTVPSSNPYTAGTGITLTGNTFSADNTIAIWNASQLLGNNISTVAPNSGEVLGWNGTTWIPTIPSGTSYAAGIGISLAGNTFTNTGDLSTNNEIQSLSYTNISRTLDISLGGSSVTLPLFNTTFDGLTPVSPGGTAAFLRADGTWNVPPNSSYTSGTGITLTGNTFSHSDHTGDATGSTALTVVAIQGKLVSTLAPSSGDVMGWNGSAWAPTVPTSTPYVAGNGILLTGSTFSNIGDLSTNNEIQSLSYTSASNTLNISLGGTGVALPRFNTTFDGLTPVSPGGTAAYLRADGTWATPPGANYDAGTGITLTANTFNAQNNASIWNASKLQGNNISTVAPNSGEMLGWDGTNWIPTIPSSNPYTAGAGIILTGNTFSADNTSAIWNASKLQGNNISTVAPNSGEMLGWDGTNWIPTVPSSNPYTAGAGIILTGNTFSADNASAIWNASKLQGNNISTVAPNSGEMLGWDGTNWIPTVPSSNPYTAGAGIILTGNTFSADNASAIWNASKLQGNNISTVAPNSGEMLGWDGTNWIPTVPSSNPYTAGSGITLTGNTFSHTAHSGDVTGTTTLTIAALQGNPISAAAPSTGDVLSWNGANWIPAVPSSSPYDAGTGITLTGSTFSHSAHSGDATGATTLTIVGLQGRPVSAVAPAGGEMLGWNGVAWIPTVPASNPYTAGNGITLLGNTFSHPAHSGDATGVSSLTVVALQGRTVSAVAPANNEILKWNGAAWTPAVDNNTNYAAGAGITLNLNTFSHTAHSGDATGATTLTVVALQGRAVSAVAPAAGNVLGWSGAAWIPTVPAASAYAAGAGITLNLNTFSHIAHSGDATGATTLTIVGLQGRPVSAVAPAGGEMLGWNGVAWIPTVPASNPYTAGNGITLLGNTFSHPAHSGDATGVSSLTVVALQGRTVSAVAPANNEILKWNGAAWTPAVDNNTNYAAGAGITLNLNTFSHTAHSGDATGATTLTVVALQGRAVSAVAPAAGNVLGWSGAAWVPTVPAASAYAAGAGITLNLNTFSHIAHSGDATGATTLTIVGLQGRPVSAVAPAGGEMLGWNGVAWIPTVPASNPYTAGNGITLTGNTFSHPAHSGDATGATTLTVVALQGKAVSAVAPANNEILKWNGTAWIPAVDNNTNYAAGAGITLNLNTFSHTAHSGDATGTTTLTVVALQGRAVSAVAPAAGNVLGWSGAAWVPTVPAASAYAAGAGITLNLNTFSHIAHSGDATGATTLTVVALQGRTVSAVAPANNEILKWNGAAWTPAVDNNTNYAAGAGITLNLNTFTHTAHSGDATGASTLTVVGLQSRPVSAAAPVAGNVLGWNGATWLPTAAGGAAYAAGVGLALNANTFTNIGDLSSVNEIQDISYNNATRALTISLGGLGTTLPIFTNAIAGLTPVSPGGITTYLRADGTWNTPVGTTYDAGAGITLNANTFSHTAHTGDATGATTLTVVGLQSRPVSAVAPANNEILKWNGATWSPAADNNTTYAAGTGITLTGTTFSHTAHTGDAIGATSLTVVALQGRNIATTIPSAGSALVWDGVTSSWTPTNGGASVTGAGVATRVAFWDGPTSLSSNAALYWDNLNSRLGIGTGVPNEQFELTGNIRIPNTSNATAGNIFKGANRFIHNYGTGTTFIGVNAGNFALTGINNTGVGTQALNAVTTGVNNTATGFQALLNNTSGGYNTAYGSLALSTNTNGYFNTASGYQALTTNSAGYYNTATGYRALSTNSTGYYNTATGYQALANSTTSNGNSAFGYNALLANTTGYYNVAMGYQPLVTNTTGFYNVALGVSPLNANTTGAYNVAIGYQPLYNNDAGQLNVGIGYQALYSNLNSGNTAIGSYSLYTNSSGRYNTATGYASLYSNVSGNFNEANGLYALYSNITGSDNVASGYSALRNNTTGSNNTAVGNWALTTWAQGSNNTAIGYNANMGANNLSNATAIGNGATATANNQVRLGNGAVSSLYCMGPNGTTTASAPNLYIDPVSGQIMRSTLGIGLYAAGPGITLFANTFSHAAHSGDITGATTLTVVGLRGRNIATTTPTIGDALTWNGINWIPAAAGNVIGTGVPTQVTFWNGANSISSDVNLYWDNGTKALGIGTSTPNEKLEISGNFRMPNNSSTGIIYKGANTFIHNYGTGSTFLGIGAGNLTLSGQRNTATGYQAMTANTTGGNNTASGYQAMTTNTSGGNNTATGYQAMTANTTGGSNTATGYQAMTANTDGYYNTATGSQALTTNQSGYYNTATGYQALQGTTSNGNSAFGFQALYTNISGTYNVAMGYQPLYRNVDGNYNVGIGYQALTRHISNPGNTAIGSFALSNEQTGSYNTATGYASLFNTSTGTNNTAIGSLTLINNTTGSGNTAIGYNANVSANNFSNATAIGNGALATSSNQMRLGNAAVTSLYCSGPNGTTTVNAPNLYINPVTGQIQRSTSGVGSSYDAGLGITLLGTTFSHTAHSGDATGATTLTVVGLRGRNIANVAPAAGNVLTWSGTDWTPTNAGLYDAGAGITLNSNTFSHTAHTGDATGTTSLTVVALQGRNMAATAPTDRNVLTWNNAATRWEPALLTSLADGTNDTKITVESIPHDDKIKFSTVGTQKMVIDNNGNVGIGVTSPISTLDIGGSISYKVNTVNASLTLDNTHYTVLVNATPVTISLPTAVACPGRVYHIKSLVGVVTITPLVGTQTIDGVLGGVAINQWEFCTIISDGANWFIISK